MPAILNRFSLSSLFLIAVAFAAYQSGRLKEQEYVRATKIAEADAAGLRARTNTLEQLARTWKSIALESRPLADSAGTRFRRWNVNTASLRAADYTEKLDALGIKLLAVSTGREFYVLSDLSSQLSVSPSDTIPDCGGIVQGGTREQELVERAGFREMPADVLILLPHDLVAILEAQELARAKRMGLQLSQIGETSFDLVQQYGDQTRPVTVRSIRPSGKSASSN
jgi:hypothetical protein